jgi:hypothetical protein
MKGDEMKGDEMKGDEMKRLGAICTASGVLV